MATTAILSTINRRKISTAALRDRLLRYFSGTDLRRDLRSLSQAQLNDAGIDSAAVSSGPLDPADAATMIRLMSLR